MHLLHPWPLGRASSPVRQPPGIAEPTRGLRMIRAQRAFSRVSAATHGGGPVHDTPACSGVYLLKSYLHPQSLAA